MLILSTVTFSHLRNLSAKSFQKNLFNIKQYSHWSKLSKKPPKYINLQRTSPWRGSATNTVLAEQELGSTASKWVGRWLFACSGMVFGAVALGGLTRLTESGLSMTDWHLFGKRPPFSVEEWLEEFQMYKQFPEYKMKNKDITLAEFQFIWWMEYMHRQWGRAIGSFFAVPAAYFWYKGYFNSMLKKRVLACGLLIGFQGLLGWYMVKSGLEDRFKEQSDVPRVSQYRLSAHLGTAFVLYSLFLWNALRISMPAATVTSVTPAARTFRILAHTTKGWVFLTALSGAFVAGLDAGLLYNSFPKMADRWIPTDLFAMSPTIKNFTENPTTVQFIHRIMGTTSVLLATTVLVLSRNRVKLGLPPRAYTAAATLGAVAWMQVGLGISTLLLYVPTWLASMHQCGSLLTLSSALWLTHELRHVKKIVK